MIDRNNFDERSIQGLPADLENFYNVDVYISRPRAKGTAPESTEAVLRFVSGGAEFSLAGIPFDSLKKLANFILVEVDDFERGQQASRN